MMAIRQIDNYLYERTTVAADDDLFPDPINTPLTSICSDYPDLAQISEDSMSPDKTVKRRGSRVLEERLQAARKELKQNAQEHDRLLEMARIQADKLAILEPMPRLFLARIEGMIRGAMEPYNTAPASCEMDIGLEEIDSRFNQAIDQLRTILDPKHFLENKELQAELTQSQSALAAKRKDALNLVVEQENLTQRLEAVSKKLLQADAETLSQADRIKKLQSHIKDLEAKQQQSFIKSRSIKARDIDKDPNAFTFAANNFKTATTSITISHFILFVLGLILGGILTFAIIRVFKLQIAPIISQPKSTNIDTAIVSTKTDPKAIQQDILSNNRFGPELVTIPSGTFTDNLQNLSKIYISSFLLGRYEVTFEQYDVFAQATGRPMPKDQGFGRGQNPVINITWNDAQAYTRWLSKQTNKKYRLPTAVEWQYAITGGSQTRFWWGNDFVPKQEVCANCGTRWDAQQPAPVGSMVANPYGLYDMGGNVMEWVHDCANHKTRCTRHIAMGGAYNMSRNSLYSSAYKTLKTQARYTSVGFRVVREIR